MPFRSRRPTSPVAYRLRARPSYLPDRYISPLLERIPPMVEPATIYLVAILQARVSIYRSFLRSHIPADVPLSAPAHLHLPAIPLAPDPSLFARNDRDLLAFFTDVLVDVAAPAAAVELDRLVTGVDPGVAPRSTSYKKAAEPLPQPFDPSRELPDLWQRIFPDPNSTIARRLAHLASQNERVDPVAYPGGRPASPPAIPTTSPPAVFEPFASTEGAWLRLRLNAVDPAARAWAAQRAGYFVQQITTYQREVIRDTVTRLLANPETNLTISQAVDHIANHVGLHRRYANAVNNRFLDMIDRGADPDFAARTARKYAADLRTSRARTIVRTETLSAANAGRDVAWRTGQSVGLLPLSLGREWLAAPDGALNANGTTGPCDICDPMDGQVVPDLDSPFVTPRGVEIHSPPLHPNCRCVVLPVVPNRDT